MLALRLPLITSLWPCLALADLRSDLTSTGIAAIFPGDPAYASASAAYNRRFTFYPTAVTYPKSAEDVSEIIQLAASNNLHVAARSGGHSYIANGLGGANGSLVVDLQNMKNIMINSSANTATIETGNRLGDIALALNDAGRALPHGMCPTVGIGGHSGYGGFGLTSRMWGLTLDAIRSIDLVLGNGTIVTASASQYSNLFWALQGSSGSFGIVISLEFKTFPVPPSAISFSYNWHLDVVDATNAVLAMQNSYDLPAPLGIEMAISRGLSSGSLSLELKGSWYGPSDQFNSSIMGLLEALPMNPKATVQSVNYIQSLEMFLGEDWHNISAPSFDSFYIKSLLIPQSAPMTQKAAQAVLIYLATNGSSSDTMWTWNIGLYGGTNSAINAVGVDSTAYAHRDKLLILSFIASSPNHQPPFPFGGLTFVDGMVNSIVSQMPRNWDYGAYPNEVDNRLEDWQKRYYGAHYPRLKKLKHIYDPKHIFNFPTSIEG